MNGFVFYVLASEWINVKEGFLHIRGSIINGSFEPEGVYCVAPHTGQYLRISGEGLLPSRPGSDLKALAYGMRERVFTSKDRPRKPIDGHMLFSMGDEVEFQDVPVTIIRSKLVTEDMDVLSDFVYPVTVKQNGATALLLFEDDQPLLRVFSNQPMKGKLDLILLNKSVVDGVAFEVEC